jgi:D-lactate dehydrogenase
MNILFFQTSEKEQEIITRELGDHDLTFINDDKLSNHTDAIASAEIISVFVNNEVPVEILEAAPRLHMIATRSTGFDHIDLSSATAKGISVANVPTYGARTVAEFTFALILVLSRKAYAAYDRLRESGQTDVRDYEGFNLCDKTIGIVGLGNIGKNVARIAHGFDMNIVAFDVHPDESFGRELNIEFATLEDLAAKSDILTLHVPYMQATHHLVNHDILELMQPGSHLVNTSRGAVVDTSSLLTHLHNGSIAGAALDVIEGEKDIQDEISLLLDKSNDIETFRDIVIAHELVDMPNVIVTPHIAFNTKEAKREILDTTILNITSFINNEPIHIVSQ